MEDYTYSPQTLANLADVARGLRQELLRGGAVKSNPYGGESYVDRLGPARAAQVRGDRMFPRVNGGEATRYDDAFMFSKSRKKYIPPGRDKLGRDRKGYYMSVNAGLIMAWGGPVAEKQQEYGPTMNFKNEKNETITVSWAGEGWKMLKRLANVEPAFTGTIQRGSRTIEGAYLPCQDLTPWSPSNPDGTAIWNYAAKLIIDGKVRKDEKFVAAGMMDLIGKTLQSLVAQEISSGQRVSSETLREAKESIANYLDAALLTLFGTVDPFEIDKIHEEGKKSIEEYAATKAAERGTPSAQGGTPLTGLAALARR